MFGVVGVAAAAAAAVVIVVVVFPADAFSLTIKLKRSTPIIVIQGVRVKIAKT